MWLDLWWQKGTSNMVLSRRQKTHDATRSRWPSSRPTLRIADSLLESRFQSQRFPQLSNTSSPSAANEPNLQAHAPMGKRSCPNQNSFLAHPSGPCSGINCICRKRMCKNQARVSNHKGGTVIGQRHYCQGFINSNRCPKWKQELIQGLLSE